MVYFNFFNFIAFFLEFSISRWVGTERNESIIFIFSFSHLFQTYFGLKRIHNRIFYFFVIFLEFSITRPVGTKRNDNFYILSFSSFLQLFLARNEAIMVFFKSLNFFAIFFLIFYSASGWNETER